MKRVLAIILGGGAGTRLYPLTKLRAKPAVPLGAKYRLIDIPISNCINSEIYKIAILTQFNSVSLHRHISRTYQFDAFHTGWVQIWAAEPVAGEGGRAIGDHRTPPAAALSSRSMPMPLRPERISSESL